MLRATFRSMLARKLRLILSTIAVVLGVMAVSGSFVLTDTLTRSFNGLFTDIYEFTEIEVSKTSDLIGLTGQPVPGNLPAADVPRVAAVPGVRLATGQVFADGAKVVDKGGKVVLGTGGPRFGANWPGDTELIKIRTGRAPVADNEIMLSANVAKTTGYGVGDTVEVLTTLAPKKEPYQLVGIVGYSGGRDSLAGETSVFFTEAVAQQLMLGEPRVYNTIDVKVTPNADLTVVRDRIAAALGTGYSVRTGEELAEQSSEGLREAFQFINYVLLGFAGIALFVGVFLILNTFSIVVAQRTRELALFRAIGAGRRQVIWSVLAEAALIGLISSIVGLGLGIGIGALLGGVLGGFLTGDALELAPLGVPPAAIIAAFAVGLGVTILAALLPAIRASTIPPVAAMRDVAAPDRPLTVLTVSGSVVFVAGATTLGLGLAGSLGDANLWGVLGGVLVCFIGVALLTPVISRPVVAALGRLLSWTAAGTLGRRNSARNPRRTAITAAALMVSVALVTAISVIFTSIQASAVQTIESELDADIVIAADPLTGGFGSIDPDTLAAVRALPEVASVVGVYGDLGQVNGTVEFLTSFDDPALAARTFGMTLVSGRLAPIGAGQTIVDDQTASDRGLAVGSTVTIRTARGEPEQMTIVGTYERSSVTVSGFVVSASAASAGFASPVPSQAYAAVAPGANVDTTLAKVQDVLKDSPEVNAITVDDYVASQRQFFDIALALVQFLLAFAMIIAVLGVINTLLLSMVERTRELGMLRAVGMKRGQMMWMVTVESVVICVFGALLGIAVGVGLGVAVFQALRDEGFTALAFPWPLMLVYVFASVIVGLAAGLFPALRAARTNVLQAIAYE